MRKKKIFAYSVLLVLITLALSASWFFIQVSNLQPVQKEEDNVVGSTVGDVSKILDRLPVSISQLNVQTTPIAASEGYVYTANIEHGPDGDTDGINLKTVVRQGRRSDSGEWEWSSVVIEDRTVHDPWHTSPSIAVDKDGYIHVAYNMHNLPWQYKKSQNPRDITRWDFLGQKLKTKQLEALKYKNQVSYPTHGKARIPGNQVTYPAFYHDRENELYISYRFAARPARPFVERTFSGGLAKYDRTKREWTSIGEEVENQKSDFKSNWKSQNKAIALAGEMGWTVYHPRIVFDASNNLGVFQFWREGTAGGELSRPCFYWQRAGTGFQSAEGDPMVLPVTSDRCGNMGIDDSQLFYGLGNATASPSGTVSVLLSPKGGDSRFILSYSKESRRWEREYSPSNAIEIFYDHEGNLWAATHEFKLYRKLANEAEWQKIYEHESGNECYPKARLNSSGTVAYIHTQSCENTTVSVFGVQLKAPSAQ